MMDDIENPHYLDATISASVRKDRNNIRYSRVFTSSAKVNSKSRPLNEKLTVKKRKDIMKAEDRIANEEVIRSMNHKLNYLRNPRNLSMKLSKTLTALPSKDRPSSTTDEFIPVDRNLISLFESDPKVVIFSEYEPGREYTKYVSFRNISAVSRSLRILPPKTSLFSMSELKYPLHSESGFIAPGMSVTTVITFKPTSLSDFQDAITISSESGKLIVPLLGQREAPRLSIPSIVDIGTCLVGDASRRKITCTNTGGASKIKIYPDDELDGSQLCIGCIRSYPFTVYPVEFSLKKNEAIDIIIEFVPLEISNFTRNFIVQYDNDSSSSFSVHGESKVVTVSIIDVNESPVPATSAEDNVKSDLYFDNVFIGSEHTQTLTVVNDTGTALEYEWVLISASSDSSTDELFSMAQNKLHEQSMIRQQQMNRQSASPSRALEFMSKTSVLESPSSQAIKCLDISSMHRSAFNATSEYGFEVNPCRGVLSGDGLENINISFHPTTAELVDVHAVLVIKGIPYAAMTNSMQRDRLLALQYDGHGAYPRLRSWMEDIGVTNLVDTYINEGNGAYLSDIRITSLESVLVIVQQHVRNSSEELGKDDDDLMAELQQFDQRVASLLDHVNRWQQHAIEVDDEEIGIDSPSHDSISKRSFTQLDSINGEESSLLDESNSTISANDSSSLKLFRPNELNDTIIINSFFLESDANSTSNQNYAAAVTASPVYPPLKIKKFRENLDEKVEANTVNLLTANLKPYDPLVLPACVWLSSSNICALLGDILSSKLNDLVHHEAVDYLRNHCLTNVAYSSTRLAGRGMPLHANVKPSFINLPGENPIGKSWNTTARIVNPTTSLVELLIDVQSTQIVNINQMPTDRVHHPIGKAVSIECEVDRLVIMPESESSLTLTVTGHDLGKYLITIPLLSSNNFTTADPISIAATVTTSKLRFDVAEVDVGLVGVGLSQQLGLNFVNESDSPLRYIFSANIDVEPETTSALLSSRPSRTSRYNQIHSPASRSVVSSRGYPTSRSHGTHRSGDTSPTGSMMSSDRSYQIENPTASINFEPCSNIILVNQSSAINVICKGGRVPQRIRGTISCQVYDQSGQIELYHHMINLRGEVQAPKVIIYPQSIDLQDIYVGVPVSFEITVQNLSNLSTKFKFDYPSGLPTSYKLTFDTEKGTLSSKEVIRIRGEITALAPGVIDDIYSVKVFGLLKPLGMVLTARSRGIAYEVSQLYPSDPYPQALCHPSCSQYKPTNTSADGPHENHAPEPKSCKVLSFYEEVALYDRASITIALRNFSPISLQYRIRFEKYHVLGNEGDQLAESFNDILSRNRKATDDRARFILPPDSLVIKPAFNSKDGQLMTIQKTQRVEDKKYLQSRLGAAYLITPSSSGVVEPWGCSILTINACNDMPGCYNDNVLLTYIENGVEKVHTIPLKMSVEGCPLTIDRNTVGMSYIRDSKLISMIGKPLLRMGQGIVNATPMQRIFVVKNNGSNNSTVSWKLSKHRTKNVGFEESDASAAVIDGIVIEPASAMIHGYSSQSFKVSFTDVSRARIIRVIAEAEINFDSEDAAQLIENKSSLSMMIEGEYLNPIVSIGKKKHVMTSSSLLSESMIDQVDGITLVAHAPLLCSDMKQSSDSNSASSSKLLTITNPLEIEMEYTISTSDSYAVSISSDKDVSKTKKLATTASSQRLQLHLAPHVSSLLRLCPSPLMMMLMSRSRKHCAWSSVRSRSSKIRCDPPYPPIQHALMQSLRL
jgi:hypothetical protein